MNKLLSIIIPVYNVEQYICKCIESLLIDDRELFDLLDIVIINDGTPDNSALIAKDYEKKYAKQIRVIDQENRGHGGAWNHGTELAVGKYLFYLDSDDWLNTEQLEKLVLFLKECDTDMVMLDKTDYYAFENKTVIRKRHDMIPDKIYDASTYDWFGYGDGSLVTYAHNTVYRTSLMQKFMPLFCEHVMYDDVSLQMIPITIAKDFVYKPLNVYNYLIGRLGQSFDPAVRAKHNDHVTEVIKFVLEWMRTYREVAPAGTTRRAWVDDLYTYYGAYHLWQISVLPYAYVKQHAQKWYDFVKVNYPDTRKTHTVRLFETMPLPLYYAIVKMEQQWGRCVRFVKRKFK